MGLIVSGQVWSGGGGQMKASGRGDGLGRGHEGSWVWHRIGSSRMGQVRSGIRGVGEGAGLGRGKPCRVESAGERASWAGTRRAGLAWLVGAGSVRTGKREWVCRAEQVRAGRGVADKLMTGCSLL